MPAFPGTEACLLPPVEISSRPVFLRKFHRGLEPFLDNSGYRRRRPRRDRRNARRNYIRLVGRLGAPSGPLHALWNGPSRHLKQIFHTWLFNLKNVVG